MQFNKFAVVPLVLTSVALITAFLALFSGTNHDMLETNDMLTLNVSRIGVDFFKNSTKHGGSSNTPSDHHGGFFSSLFQNATSQISNITGEVEDKIQKDLNNVLQSLAKDLGIKDFYSVHVLNHCEGFFKNNGSDRNVTNCTSPDGFSGFNATQILARELNSSHINVTLSQLHWPQAITDAENSLKLAFNASFIIWTIGIVFTAIAWLACPVGLFGDSRKSALLNVGVSSLALFMLIVASIIFQVGINKVTDAINYFGKEINVNAKKGNGFLGLIWSTTALVGVSAFTWLVQFLLARRKMRREGSYSETKYQG